MRQHFWSLGSPERRPRSGVTLVEVLVTIGVLALLFALLLPAIGLSRAVCITHTCRARMSQVGLAVHNFEERNQRYPISSGHLDWHFELLPDLDRTELFRQAQGHAEESGVLERVFLAASFPIFQCPSDPQSDASKNSVNFMRNGGSMFRAYEEEDSHAFLWPPVSSRDVTDGLSVTAYVSEQMNEFRLGKTTDRRDKWRTPVVYAMPNELDLFADLCESMPVGAVGGPIEGSILTFFHTIHWYDHIVRPNYATCANAIADGDYVAHTANSLHGSGVHVLMADGAVRFVNDGVTRPVWRAMGTRNGHEVVTLP